MYQKKEYIKHNRYGVCQIDDIMIRKLANGEKKQYYVMHKIDGIDTKISTPIDSKELNLVASLSTVNKLIEEMPHLPNLWISDNKKRTDHFQKIVKEGDIFSLAAMIQTIYQKKEEKRKENKTLSVNDTKFMNWAEKKLHDELAFCLNIKAEEVVSYLLEHVSENETMEQKKETAS